jgi:AraC-like DNA-binding protein
VTESPQRLRIERGGALADRTRVEDRPSIVLPLESSVVELHVDDARHRLDRASFALVPAKKRFRVRSISPVTRLLTVFVGDDALRRVRREYAPQVDGDRFATILSLAQIFPRTRWVDEIAQRYLFEIDVCEKHGSRAARFLETELAKELYFLGSERIDRRSRASVVSEEGDLVRRARETIESDLFSPLRVDALARACHTSESTLLRAFRRELGVAPATYVRDRRLDESLLMIESGRFSVGEVATRVGYESLSAFSVAFRRRFGVVPSRAKNATPRSQMLPPHGSPPVRGARRKRRSG